MQHGINIESFFQGVELSAVEQVNTNTGKHTHTQVEVEEHLPLTSFDASRLTDFATALPLSLSPLPLIYCSLSPGQKLFFKWPSCVDRHPLRYRFMHFLNVSLVAAAAAAADYGEMGKNGPQTVKRCGIYCKGHPFFEKAQYNADFVEFCEKDFPPQLTLSA